MKKILAVLAVVVMAGCASGGNTLVTTGESLRSVGTLYLEVSQKFVDGCAEQALAPFPVELCKSYRDFQVRFREAYPLAIGLWEVGVAAKDVQAQAYAAKAVQSLADELSKFISAAVMQLGRV